MISFEVRAHHLKLERSAELNVISLEVRTRHLKFESQSESNRMNLGLSHPFRMLIRFYRSTYMKKTLCTWLGKYEGPSNSTSAWLSTVILRISTSRAPSSKLHADAWTRMCRCQLCTQAHWVRKGAYESSMRSGHDALSHCHTPHTPSPTHPALYAKWWIHA